MTPIPPLPLGCRVRKASAQDIWNIRRLVFSALLDPTQLRWDQFWVVEHDAQVIACGQLRQFPEAQELGSLVVRSSWRHQGIGKHLTQWLIQQATLPLYLECLGKKRAEFYTALGFVPVSWSELPQSLKRKFALSAFAHERLRLPIYLLHYPDGGIAETR